MSGPVLEARGVTRSFGTTEALRGADLTVGYGEVLAVMGPSGSGKSTLLHCLAGILRPDSGEVWFAGRRTDRLGERARTELRRRSFGFVFQFGQLVPDLPAIENVMLPLLLAGQARAAAREQAAALLARLELDGLEQRRPGELLHLVEEHAHAVLFSADTAAVFDLVHHNQAADTDIGH